MTHAYDNILLDRASDTLGRMLDYSAYSLHYDAGAMMDLFIASGTAALFECGDIRTITGMSGVELAYEVMERSGISFQRAQPRHTKGLSPEYWCGHALARMQWTTGLTFHQVLRSFSPAAFISSYGNSRFAFLDALPLDISAEERSEKMRTFGSQFSDDAVSAFVSASAGSWADEGDRTGAVSALKMMRMKNGLSQSGLARASGKPVRTIQQYEQGQKDLSKARAEYLIALSRALGCDPALLLAK